MIEVKLQSDTIGKLASALAKAQSEFPIIEKAKTVKVETKGGRTYSYDYADLADCITAVKPILAKYEISVSQQPMIIDGKPALGTMLMHSSGEWQRSIMQLPPATDPQQVGGLYTYFRRYSLCAVLGVAAEEDDDAQYAQSAAGKQKAERIQQNLPAKPVPTIEDEIPDFDSVESPRELEGLAAYVIPIGKKYNGQRLGDVPKADLVSFLSWAKDAFKKDGKTPMGKWKEAMDKIEEFTRR